TDGGATKVVADYSTPVPGTLGNFIQFSPFLSFHSTYGSYAFDGNTVVFVGDSVDSSGAFTNGVYTYRDGKLQGLVDSHTALPGLDTKLTAFQTPSISDGSIVFFALNALGNHGIYTTLGGTLRPVIEAGTLLDGKVPSGLDVS